MLCCTMDGQKGPLCNTIWLLLCQQMAERREEKLSSAVCGSHQTAPNMARKGCSGAAAYPPNWEDPPPPPPTLSPPSQLSSINSVHTGRQPGILHIPQPSYLKFISNNCSIKGNVCNLHTAVIIGLRAGLYIHVDNGWSLNWVYMDTASMPLNYVNLT